MTIRKKIYLIILLVFVFFMVAMCFVSRYVLFRQLTDIEEKRVEINITRGLRILENDLVVLSSKAGDWATWDETYAFIKKPNEHYIRSNLTYVPFIELRLNFMVFVDASFRLVYAKGFDLKTEKEVPWPKDLLSHIKKGSLLAGGISQGILSLKEGAALISLRPIVLPGEKSPVAGNLIMGRYLSGYELEQLSSMVNLHLDVCPLNDPSLPPGIKKGLLKNLSPFLVEWPSNQLVVGYALIKDIYRRPSYVLKVNVPCIVYPYGPSIVSYLGLWLSLLAIALGVAICLLFERSLLSRLLGLSASVRAIGRGRDLRERVKAEGDDEVAEFAGSINDMLFALERSKQIEESERRYRRLFDNALTGNFICLLDGTITLCNKAFARMLGYEFPKGVIGKSMISIFLDEGIMFEYIYRRLSVKQNVECKELELQCLDGRNVVTIGTIVGIFDADGFFYQIEGYLMDITNRKKMEDELKYLSLHDALTGLYNRAYLDQEIKRLVRGRSSAVSLIICDIDILKYINDTLGHGAGDELIMAAAKVIQESFRLEDIVARIGGDEFAVLLPKSDPDGAMKACSRLKEEIENYNRNRHDWYLSISIGCAVSEKAPFDIKKLFREADDNMYKDKLERREQVRQIITSARRRRLRWAFGGMP